MREEREEVDGSNLEEERGGYRKLREDREEDIESTT